MDLRIERGQSWLDQIRSEPEVIFTTRLSGETSKVQAGWVPSRRRCTAIGPPPAAFGTDGSTLTSSAAHSPDGGSSGTWLAWTGTLSGTTGPSGVPAEAEVPDDFGVDAVVLAWSAGWSEPVPISLPMPKTRAAAMTRTIVRRNQ